MRKLLAAAVITLGLLALLGASKGGTYQGGTYGTAGASYQAGGGAAGWDTVVVIFHPGARVDSTATTGKWLFPIPTAYTGADTVKNPRQNHRIWRLNDKVLGRGNYPGGGSWRDDGGDTARVVRLGTGYACPTFAWTNIKENDTDGFYPSQYQYIRCDVRQLIESVSYLQQQIGADGANRTVPMFYIPFENHIPAGSTIVSATANFANFNAMYYANNDSIISVLMSNAQDNDWYTVKGGTGLNAASPNYAKASWLYQTDTNASTGTAWGGSQANAWTPTLAERNYYWNMGTTSDWSGGIAAPGGFIAAEAGVNVDVTDGVQASVAGTTNNGIAILWQSGGTTSTEPILYGWDNFSSATGRNPFVAVKYITKRYQQPYGTSDLAFVFTTDDYIENANSAFTDTFNAHGGIYTMFGARKHVDGTVKQSGMDSLLTWLAEGHEIGTHSRTHQDPLGLTHWERNRPGLVWDATARAEVWHDAEPDWLYALADSATGDSLKSHPNFAKSLALPNNTISMGVQRVLADLGYLSVRGRAYTGRDRTMWYLPNTWGPAYGDTMMSTGQQAQRRPRNMMMLPFEMTPRLFVGHPAGATADLDSVRHNMRRALYQWRGQDRGQFVMLTHDVKHTNPLASGFDYDDGIDPAELGAMLDVVDEIGARYMTASDLGRWRRATAQAIDTPAGFYNAVASDDSAKYFAADETWYKPNGIDNRWIRGVR